MYLNELSKLRDYDVSEDLIRKLDSYLREAGGEAWRFTPGHAANAMGTEPDITEGVLLKAAEAGVIEANFEVECPEGDSDFFARSLGDIDWDTERQCRACETLYQPSPDRIWVTFLLKGTAVPKAHRRP